MSNCLACKGSAEPVLDFGKMPIANGFLQEDEFAAEFFHHLRISFCPDCSMVQLADPVDPSIQYHENYAYFASTSSRMRDHFTGAAIQIQALLPDRTDLFIVNVVQKLFLLE